VTEVRRLARDTQNKKKGFLMGIRERVVKSETTSLTPITRLKTVHFQFSPITGLNFENFKTMQHIKITKGICPHAMTIFPIVGTLYT
jgi:hypothetical protein